MYSTVCKVHEESAKNFKSHMLQGFFRLNLFVETCFAKSANSFEEFIWIGTFLVDFKQGTA